jgi:hypothetical protein
MFLEKKSQAKNDLSAKSQAKIYPAKNFFLAKNSTAKNFSTKNPAKRGIILREEFSGLKCSELKMLMRRIFRPSEE